MGERMTGRRRVRARACALWVPAVVALLSCTSFAGGADLPEGYMAEEQSGALLEKTLRIHMDPDISHLSDAEREVVGLLIEVGKIFDRLHLRMRHHQAIEAHEELLALDARLILVGLLDELPASDQPLVENLGLLVAQRVIGPRATAR